MLFDNNDIDLDFSLLNIANLNNNDFLMNDKNTMPNLFSAKDGFLRGNIFKNEYKPYKNLTYIDIKPKNDQEAKLFNVMQYSFAINDMNLYLDLHPDDKKAMAVFEDFVKEAHNCKKEYEESYGPLSVTHTKGNNFDWIDNPWPWENLGGNMYV